MLTIRRPASLAPVAAAIRAAPRQLQYAASSALTASAREAQRRIVAQMPIVFDRPVPYTRNALRVVPSTVQSLAARVAVKDDVGGTGIAPEKFLEPEVEGGLRGEKRFERALRFAGVMRSGESAMPGAGAPLDAYGNVSAGTIRQIMAQLGALVRNGETVKGKRLRRGAGGVAREYFAGAAGRRGTRGIWLREGGRITPILVFVRKRPVYRSRLDFVGIAERAARDVFPAEFEAASAALAERFRT